MTENSLINTDINYLEYLNMGKGEIAETDELSDVEEMDITDNEDNELERTLPWPVKINNNSSNSTDISKYTTRNPYIIYQNVSFEELTIDQHIVINGATWRAAVIYILPGIEVKCINSGSLILIQQSGEETEILGNHSQNSLTADIDAIIL